MQRWKVLAIVGMALVVGLTGCKRRAPKGGPGGAGDVTGIVPTGVYGEELGERFAPGREERGRFTPVYFDYDSSVIKESEKPKLEEVARYLRSAPSVNLLVEGHCDERGSNEYNLALGERRALAIRAHLIGLGIDGARIQTVSYGEERPAVVGHDESAWRFNRRGEFVLVH